MEVCCRAIRALDGIATGPTPPYKGIELLLHSGLMEARFHGDHERAGS